MSAGALAGPGGPPAAGWRIARERYADLSGEGARLKGGRWNSPGRAVVYMAEGAALPLIEVLVHLDLTPDLMPEDYVLMKIDLGPFAGRPADEWLEDGPAEPLGETDSAAFGDAWLEADRTPLLRVPSAIVPEAFNLVLNAGHPLAADLPPPESRPFAFDRRLFAAG